jgi:protein O-GlcNAc transferase
MGYMKHNRLGIFAFRPAPVQVEYLGYPGTTGADFIDYLITDHVVTPKGDNTYYSENLVRLPHCYQINDNTQKISAKSFNRAECGLPQNAFVFCSFNTDYKIDRSVYQILGEHSQASSRERALAVWSEAVKPGRI